MYILLLSLGTLIGIILSPLETFIHELGHCFGILLIKRKINTFNERLYIKPTFTPSHYLFKTGKTYSNLLKHLSDNQPKYKTEIFIVAIAGVLFSSFVYIILLFVSIYYKSFLFIGFWFFFIFRELLSFFTSKKEQSDINIIKCPEKYRYNCYY